MVVMYLNLDGVELDNCRTIAYARSGYNAGGLTWQNCTCCSPTDWYKVVNCGTEFATPSTDKLSWVSSTEPDSADFAGFVITGIEGLDLAPTSRPVVDRINDGGQFGRQRRGPLKIRVAAIALGRTCTAAWWGVRWLNEVLREPTCSTGCTGTDLTYYLNCPDFSGSCLIPNSPGAIETAILPYKRTLHNVQLTDGVFITDRINLARCCGVGECNLPVIEFTLTAADPHSYMDAITAVTNGVLFPCAGSGTCPTWVVLGDDEIPAPMCSSEPVCAGDAVCGTSPVPPDPPVLKDPCVCDPITLTTTCFDLDADDFSDLGQTVPVFTIKSGVDAMRGTSVRFIPREGAQLNVCDTCFEINISYIPPNATWTFDAERRVSTLTCAGQTNSATVTGEDGGPLIWPVFECVPSDYAMCVTTACGVDVSAVEVNVSLVTRHG